MINLIIDNKKVSVKEGTSILEACQQENIYIPTLCYDPDLQIEGSCRLCVVKIQGRRGLSSSCVTPCAEGMVVETENSEVIDNRKVILELLVARHPLNCHECVKSGQCKLEEYCLRYNVKESRFSGQVIDFRKEDSNPFILRDYNLCIMCHKCVRACDEITGAQAINIKGRGYLSSIATPFDGMLKGSACVYCGQCIMVCPVGALQSKISTAKPGDIKKTLTTCSFCGVGCTFDINVQDGFVVDVTSRRDKKFSPVNNGALCVKGRFGWKFIYEKGRIKTPFIRDGQELKSCSWETALEYIVNRIQDIKAEYGPEALAMFCSSRLTNEEIYLAQKWMRAGIGSNNINQCSKINDFVSVSALRASLGIGAMTNTINEIDQEAKVIFLIGSNMSVKHPVISFKLKQNIRRNGAKLIVANPRRDEIAGMAAVHLHHKKGTEATLLKGLMHIIINENLLDYDFIKERTAGFERLQLYLEKYTPAYVSKITGVSEEDLMQAARLYGEAEAASAIYSTGLFEGEKGQEKVQLLCNMALMTGNFGKPGGGINFLREQSNVQGSCDMGGLCDYFTDYQAVADPQIREKFSHAWQRELPDRAGMDIFATMEKIKEKQIRGLIVFGANPVKRNPGLVNVAETLKKLDFLMVQDLEISETAELAHIVLPGVSFVKKEGTYTNTERRVQRVRQACKAMGQARQEWEIICDLSTLMGYPLHYNNSEEIFEEMRKLTPSYTGMTYKRLEGEGLFTPCPDEEHPGTPILYKEGFPLGSGKFFTPED